MKHKMAFIYGKTGLDVWKKLNRSVKRIIIE
jgi:hypothetical protein